MTLRPGRGRRATCSPTEGRRAASRGSCTERRDLALIPSLYHARVHARESAGGDGCSSQLPRRRAGARAVVGQSTSAIGRPSVTVVLQRSPRGGVRRAKGQGTASGWIRRTAGQRRARRERGKAGQPSAARRRAGRPRAHLPAVVAVQARDEGLSSGDSSRSALRRSPVVREHKVGTDRHRLIRTARLHLVVRRLAVAALAAFELVRLGLRRGSGGKRDFSRR